MYSRLVFRKFYFLTAVVALGGQCWATQISSALKLSGIDIPAGCQMIPGVHPVGTKSGMLYEYNRYAAVLPPLTAKGVQSFQCNGQKGSLLFFQYKSESDRDQAELFAKPVLSKEDGAAQPLEIREWSLGFIVVSFKVPPPDLLAALDRKLMPGTAPSSPSATTSPVPIAASPATKTPVGSVPVVENPVVASAEPVKSPVLAPVVKRMPSPPPIIKITVPLPPVPVHVIAPPPTAPVKVIPFSGSVVDLNPEVVAAYSSKLGCGADGGNPQTVSVCGLLKEFIAGTRPVVSSLKNGVPMIGPIYTIDSYGRFVDLHYDVLMGTDEPTVVSFISLVSSGGEEDFEIQTLVDARKGGKPLPANSVLTKIQQLALKKRLTLGATNGTSLIILPGGARKVYIRKSGDHLILIGPSGKTLDEQTRSSLVVSSIY